MIELLIVAPSSSFTHHVPGGFIFTDEVFAEAKLRDHVSESQGLTSELERALGYLAKRYPKRLRIRWLNLWSLGGVWVAIHYKLRSFPAVVVNQNHVLIDDQLEIESLRNFVESLLSQNKD
jgi:hypothetical protein